MQARGFITIQDEVVKVEEQGTFAIQFLSSLLLPFVESYWVTLQFVKLMPANELHTLDDIDKKVQAIAETMFSEGMLTYYESCSRESIDNAITRFSKLGALCEKAIEGNGSRLFGTSKIAFFRSAESKQAADVKDLHERLTFFKPISRAGVVSYDADVTRILQKRNAPLAKL